jgi:hypothetical protein
VVGIKECGRNKRLVGIKECVGGIKERAMNKSIPIAEKRAKKTTKRE